MTQPNDSNAPAVLITGASTGIGEACVLELDRRGFHVFAGVRDEAAGQRLQKKASPCLVPVHIDVTDGASIAAAAERIGEAVGPSGLAGLVNNAGVAVGGPMEMVPLDLLRRQLEVNVIGQVAVIQAVLPLVRTARGRIVNMSSVSGIVAAPFLGPYCASKHALEAISDSLRVELRRWGIRVSLVEPGSVNTPIWEKSRASAEELLHKMPPTAESLYGEDFDAARKATEEMARQAMPVDRVVRAVVHALTARRPKTRYPVGTDTRLVAAVWHLFSDRLHDWFMRRALGLK